MSNDIIKFIRSRDYKFIKKIGQGGLGHTVLLKDDIINENFICKKYSPIIEEAKEEYFSNFINEIKLLYILNHKNIVRIFNYYLYPDKTTGYILMEYIIGYEIDIFIKNNPEKINDIFSQTIQGFKYLENIKVLYRDIRPQNILVSDDGVVKIIDFGFGKKIQFEENFEKSISINWRYPPPLEFKEKVYNFKTEIYFIGKMFEDLIKENKIEHFAFNDLLIKMTSMRADNRPNSFFDILRSVEEKNFLEIEFSEQDTTIYRSFADGISSIVHSLFADSEYIDDIDMIIYLLNDLYQSSKLETYIQNNNKLITCFIKGGFKYNKVYQFNTYYLKQFINAFSKHTSESKRIILNHIWNRFDAVKREKEKMYEDLPF